MCGHAASRVKCAKPVSEAMIRHAVTWYCSFLAFESVAAMAEAGRAEGDTGAGAYSKFAEEWEALDEVKATRAVLTKHKAAAEKAAKKK